MRPARLRPSTISTASRAWDSAVKRCRASLRCRGSFSRAAPRDAANGARVRVGRRRGLGGGARGVEAGHHGGGPRSVLQRSGPAQVPGAHPAPSSGHVEDAVRRLALARPDVSFALHHDDRKVLEAAHRMEPARRLSRLAGEAFAAGALDIAFDAGRPLHPRIPGAAERRTSPPGPAVSLRERAQRARRRRAPRGPGRIPGTRLRVGNIRPSCCTSTSIPAAVDVNVHPTRARGPISRTPSRP